ncbi:MAG: hypothetical protein N2509_08855, partial [Treponemataceae bacterium]|nr:hypothetical protein [Treponemataceae bacterium]
MCIRDSTSAGFMEIISVSGVPGASFTLSLAPDTPRRATITKTVTHQSKIFFMVLTPTVVERVKPRKRFSISFVESTFGIKANASGRIPGKIGNNIEKIPLMAMHMV